MNSLNKKQEFQGWIVELVKLFKPAVYVEIGARFGYIFNAVSPYCKKSIAVDIISLDKIERNPGVECYRMDSNRFAEMAESCAPQIDLLFIDADHSAKAVFNDLNNLSPFVREFTGMILLHDTFPINERLLEDDRCGDAWRIAKWVHEAKKDFEIVTLPGPWAGLSIIRKVGTGHGWMDKKTKIPCGYTSEWLTSQDL